MLPVRIAEDLTAAEGNADPFVRTVRDLLPAEVGTP
jgi:hypothetical protein